MQVRFDKRSISRGLKFFFGLSIASIAVIFIFTISRDTRLALGRISPYYLLLALLITTVDWLGAGLRLYALSRRIRHRVSYFGCVRAALANTFMGAVTPSQTGGGPAQIYILYKEGLPVIESMSVSLITFLSTVFFLVLSTGSITFLQVNASIPSTTLRYMFRYGVSLFLFIGILVILFVSKPDLLLRATTLLFNFLSVFRKKHFLRPGARAHGIIEIVDRSHQIMVYYFRRAWPTVLLAVLITGVVFSAKFFAAFLIVKGLGIEAGAWEVISIQILITLAIYFCPTPGASGAAELGSAVLMSSIVPVELLMVYVILWRAIVTYVPVILGSLVILRSMGKEGVSIEAAQGVPGEKKIAVSGKDA